MKGFARGMSLEWKADFALLTDVGQVRAHNEDTCAADEKAGLFVVCDGMGGAAAGEIASQIAARVFLQQARQLRLDGTPAWRLERAVQDANRAVFEESLRDSAMHGMGTTLVAMEFDIGTGYVWTAHVGDSRCYRLRDGQLQLLTEDHSYVEEQVRMGYLTAEQAENSPLRNVITRAVGSRPELQVDVSSFPAEAGDIYLLCSDGLTGEVTEEEICGVLTAAGDSLQACASALIHVANLRGGSDNITVALVRV